MDAILEGAARVFRTDGDAPVSRIADVAGVSVGSLYQYFPGKRAIVAALVRRRLREVHEELLALLETGDPDEPLADVAPRFVDRILAMKAAQGTGDGALVDQTLRHALTEQAFALDGDLVARFAAALERRQRSLREGLPPDVAAAVLFHGLRAVMVMGVIERPDLMADPRFRGELELLFLRYLGR